MKTKSISVNDSPVIMFVYGQITHSISIPKEHKSIYCLTNSNELYGDNVNKHKALLVWNLVKF